LFIDSTLQEHLETSSTIRTNSAVIVEWNMNISNNIKQVGNYRFRPNDSETSKYKSISSSFSLNDEESQFYTGATDADILIDGGFSLDEQRNSIPITFVSKKEKEKLLYSLEDCFGRFRPRSGINKLRYFSNRYTHFFNEDMASRPRYYMADKNDAFKYWTSFRTEDHVERGISNQVVNGEYFIDDAAPYIVYDKSIPVNRIVVKMQTNVGTVDLGPFVSSNNVSGFEDPFYGLDKQTTPSKWRIQYLDNDNWIDAISFIPGAIRADGSPVIGADGYVEIGYGLIIPESYKESFYFIQEYSSVSLLPSVSTEREGSAYLVKANDLDSGTYYVVDGSGVYRSFDAIYGWYLEDGSVGRKTNYVKNLVSPQEFYSKTEGLNKYRELQYIGGIRVVVETMNIFDASFDLIEMSPRLTVDLSDKVTSFSVTKSASDLGASGMPVGQLLASTGSLSLFDYDQSLFEENTNSIVSEYLSQSIQVKLYEIIMGVESVDGLVYDSYIPVKTMYVDGFPEISNSDRSVTLKLRDLFFYLESMTAPQLFLQDVSLSYAISILLDSVGFSNYSFNRTFGEKEMVIPFFFVAPDKSVAEVLNDLAVSAQAAMFFDEYNNFIVMSKNYMMPTIDERPTSITLRGSKDFRKNAELANETTNVLLANIEELVSQQNRVFNDGLISYTSRYIQKSYSSIRQASLIDKDKTWIYKPALLWEVSPLQNTKSVNDETTQQSGYALGAMPLSSDLSINIPSVSNHILVDNIMDLGDGVYWLTKYNGYLYANGEIIKYDAVQYSIPGLSAFDAVQDGVDGDSVWITSTQEYQRFFSKVPFNGKIYPTGIVRIYSEPDYQTISGVTRRKNGVVAKHGRGQFGTQVVNHSAGLSAEWSSDNSLGGVDMNSRYLFDTNIDTTVTGAFSDTVSRGEVTIQSAFATEVVLSVITDGSKAVFRSMSHGLIVDTRVELVSTGSLPSGVSAGVQYFVKQVIDKDSFSLSITSGGAEVNISGSQSGTQSFVVVVEESSEFYYPALAEITGHRFIAGDSVVFSTTGILPEGVESGIEYVVSSTGLTKDRFLFLYPGLTDYVLCIDEGQAPTHSASSTMTEAEAATRIVLPDVSNFSIGFSVSIEAGTGTLADNTKIIDIDAAHSAIIVSPTVIIPLIKDYVDPTTSEYVFNVIRIKDIIATVPGPAGKRSAGTQTTSFERAKTTTRNGIIKNFLTNAYLEESTVNRMMSTQSGTVQSSALVMNGSSEGSTDQLPGFVSYVYKTLEDRFVHFGTRMRIIGKVDSSKASGQSPYGATTYYQGSAKASDQPVSIGGSSGGLAIMLNPETNNGYFFEIVALTESNLNGYTNGATMHNIIFYKVQKDAENTDSYAQAIPVKLWGGIGNILVDSGQFTGQYRVAAEQNPTVYDLSIEYKKSGNALVFYLYINNVLVAKVADENPLEIHNTMATFIRGASRVMFENVYALTNNYSQNTTFSLDTLTDGAFGDLDINASQSFQKYALSGIIQSTYLSGIGSSEPPRYKIYFEEFGTILREAAYFNIRYDKAYPALYATIAPTFNKLKGYSVSGFRAGAYGAEFLVFNNTDTALNLDSTSGNYLRILGITFTQQSQHEATVDEYFSKVSDLSNPLISGDDVIHAPNKIAKDYADIKFSRMTHGKNQFSLSTSYIQSQDDADNMMEWMSTKIMQPRKSIGVKVFGLPTVQLGDVAEIDYTNENGINEASATGSRFIVYSIENTHKDDGPEMILYLSEIV